MSAEVTISQILELNLARAIRQNSATGHGSYGTHLRMFKQLWGDRPAISLKREEIEDLVRAWKAEEYANSTILHRIGFLSGAYNFAIRQGLVAANPATQIPIGKIHRRHEWLDFEREARMRAAYHKVWGPELGEFWWGPERFAILTGVRLGEQAWLRPRHLSPEVLTIPEEGKTGERQLVLHPEAYQIALDWMAFSASLGSEFVFFPVAGDRNKIGWQWVIDVWNVARVVAGLPKLQSRDRRRTFGTRCILVAGMGIYEVMLLLGHATVEQTRTYCQIDLINQREGILRLR